MTEDLWSFYAGEVGKVMNLAKEERAFFLACRIRCLRNAASQVAYLSVRYRCVCL